MNNVTSYEIITDIESSALPEISPVEVGDPLTEDHALNARSIGGVGSVVKNNYAAVTNPTVTSDETEGYKVGSWWINLVEGSSFQCFDKTTGAAVWRAVGIQVLGLNGIPTGANNGVNRTYLLPEAALDKGSVLLLKNSIPFTNFEVSGDTITVDVGYETQASQSLYFFMLKNAIPAGGGGGGGGSVGGGLEISPYGHTVTAGEITAKELTLSITPTTPSRVVFDGPVGAPAIYGTSFVVLGNKLNWNGLGLEGTILDGQLWRIMIFT